MLLNLLQYSATRWVTFDRVIVKLGQFDAATLELDIVTRRGSSLEMLQNDFSLRAVLNDVANTVPEMNDLLISDAEYHRKKRLQDLFQPASRVTNVQNGTLYGFISVKLFEF